MTWTNTLLEVFELEDDIPHGWYLHRFGDGKKMVIWLESVSYINNRICKSNLVSKDHVLVVLLDNGSWFIMDLKSKHGTFVNDKIVPEEGMVLEEWDVICLGRQRPRNAKEFGFMLKYKDAFGSDQSTCSPPNMKSRSCSPTKFDLPTNEDSNATLNLQQDKKPPPTPGSPIPISSSDSEDDSDKTVKLFSVGSKTLLPTVQDKLNKALKCDAPELQQQIPSVQDKIGDWMTRKETGAGLKNGKRKLSRSRNTSESSFVATDDNVTDDKSTDFNSADCNSSDSSSFIDDSEYRTRTKKKKNSGKKRMRNVSTSESMTEDSDTDQSDELKFNFAMSKRLKKDSKQPKHDRYYEDNTWKPRVKGKSSKHKRRRLK